VSYPLALAGRILSAGSVRRLQATSTSRSSRRRGATGKALELDEITSVADGVPLQPARKVHPSNSSSRGGQAHASCVTQRLIGLSHDTVRSRFCLLEKKAQGTWTLAPLWSCEGRRS
jgi:hypothetical protein